MREGGASSSDPAEARKRRKAIISSQRQDGTKQETEASVLSPNDPLADADDHEDPDDMNDAESATTEQDESMLSKRRMSDPPSSPGSSRGKKKAQIRYDPEVPMNKEQLAAWRKEARRVRNRESAAASRQRIRCRITELEAEVEDWKSKYNQAMGRLQHLKGISMGDSGVQQENDKTGRESTENRSTAMQPLDNSTTTKV